MIKVSELRVGDICGTTSGAPLASIIKARTWGLRSVFAQDKASHIATVVDRGHGLLYLAEMEGGGLELSPVHKYNHHKPLSHICWVGRHAAFDYAIVREGYNNFILDAHARKVKYGYEDIANYLPGLHVKDNPRTWICSELPREGMRSQAIKYPLSWDIACCPADWQCWHELVNISGKVLV